MNNSRNLRGYKLEIYKSKLVLNDVQKEVIIGTLLGDSTIRLRSGKPVYAVKFEQGIKNKRYIDHLYDLFEPYCGTGPAERFIDKEQTRKAIGFSTYRHDHFIFFFNLFYRIEKKPKGDGVRARKIVPENIHKFLTPRAVAYWFMDDGSYYKNPNGYTYLLNTQGFEHHEVIRLCEALARNFDIQSSLQRDHGKWRIFIGVDNAPKFRELVEPFIIDNFLYKLSASELLEVSEELEVFENSDEESEDSDEDSL